MLKRLSLALTLSCLGVAPCSATGKLIHAYLFAGQSNTLGFINNSTYVPATADSLVRLYPELGNRDDASLDMSINDAPAGDMPSLPRWRQVVPRVSMNLAPVTMGTSSRGGSEIQFGRSAYQVLGPANYTTILKCAFGGSGLEHHWLHSPIWNFADRCMMFLEDVRAEIEANGDTLLLSGFIWYQGETDTLDPAAASVYEDNLNILVTKVRRGTSLPVVITRIHFDPPPANPVALENYSLVRAAQEAYVASDPCSTLVSVDDIPKVNGVHIAADGSAILGRRQFNALYRLIPECQP